LTQIKRHRGSETEGTKESGRILLNSTWLQGVFSLRNAARVLFATSSFGATTEWRLERKESQSPAIGAIFRCVDTQWLEKANSWQHPQTIYSKSLTLRVRHPQCSEPKLLLRGGGQTAPTWDPLLRLRGP
jgi:hypothetical protein